MIHEVPDPQPLTELIDEVKVTKLTPDRAADIVARMTMEDYEKVRHLLLGPSLVEWQQHFIKTGSLK
jgi:hypothetical protein